MYWDNIHWWLGLLLPKLLLLLLEGLLMLSLLLCKYLVGLCDEILLLLLMFGGLLGDDGICLVDNSCC